MPDIRVRSGTITGEPVGEVESVDLENELDIIVFRENFIKVLDATEYIMRVLKNFKGGVK